MVSRQMTGVREIKKAIKEDEAPNTELAQTERAASKRAHPSSARRVATIARHTFRETVRDRVLYNLVLFALLLIAAAIFLSELSAAQEAKIIVDIGLSATLLFGAFIAVFSGTSLVSKEIERRTIYAIFSKPVARGEFLFGKYLGLCLMLALNVAVMSLGVTLALLFVHGGYDPLMPSVWTGVALIYMELSILVALALLFSSFSTPALSIAFTLSVFIISHFSEDLKAFAANAENNSLSRIICRALYYLLPNFSNYSFITPAAHGETRSLAGFALAALYAAAYICALLAASTLIFKRRNFK